MSSEADHPVIDNDECLYSWQRFMAHIRSHSSYLMSINSIGLEWAQIEVERVQDPYWANS